MTGYKREKAKFVFTRPMAAVMGKPGSPSYRRFERFCGLAFNVLRKQTNLLCTLFMLMTNCGIPELQNLGEIKYMIDELHMGLDDKAAAAKFRETITESLNTKATMFNDACHLLVHG